MCTLRFQCKFGLLFLLLLPSVALAGMPVVRLTDAARLRLHSISFFLFAFLISAFVIQRLWNYLGRDFTALPRLSYPKAVGVVTLWGLLFVLILTMISGARELMTPGAWERNGSTYQLAKEKAEQEDNARNSQRRERLERLRRLLLSYAAAHDGEYPPSKEKSSIPASYWIVPDVSEVGYVYVPGLSLSSGELPLVYEPDVFGSRKVFVLLANGDILEQNSSEVDSTRKGKS